MLMVAEFRTFQLTRWVCSPLLVPSEDQDQDQLSVRDDGETECTGYTLWEQDDDIFHFNQDDLSFMAKFPDRVLSGTCKDARDNDISHLLSAVWSVGILPACIPCV